MTRKPSLGTVATVSPPSQSLPGAANKSLPGAAKKRGNAAKKGGQPKRRCNAINKSAGNAHLSGLGTTEAKPLAHRPEGKWKQDVPPPQKFIEISVEQARRSAVAQAQAMGATGNFKSFDSQFGNYLVPVVPNHSINRSQISLSGHRGMVSSSLAQPSIM